MQKHPFPVGTPVSLSFTDNAPALDGTVADTVGASAADLAREPGRDFASAGWYLVQVGHRLWEAPPSAVSLREVQSR
jgi:hypothetical protein